MASLGILVAGIAHEINTPIGVAVTSSSYLSDRVAEMNRMYREDRICKEDFVEFMNLLNESSALILTNLHNASNLIESFKRVAVDQSTEGKRKFRLNGYLADIISSLAPRIKHTPHKILVECPDTIELDSYPGALTQIISNFVINSLIHGFEGRQQGIIKINCSINNNILQLQYTDNGSGIAPENLNNIFKPFFTTKRGQGGTGLGLHIVHNIVTQKLSGSIHCNSVYGKGVDFTIKFPVESL
jgi:signal transduction histidine kinase